AASLASAVWRLARLRAEGVLHYTDAGVASWYDFACAIAEEGVRSGLLEQAPTVLPIATEDYPTAAVRPAFSVLDCRETWLLLEGPAPHWRVSLTRTLAEIAA
ncbi:MAG: sugar nucleotide-binding protein, partial [Gemmatimonadales bacterium]